MISSSNLNYKTDAIPSINSHLDEINKKVDSFSNVNCCNDLIFWFKSWLAIRQDTVSKEVEEQVLQASLSSRDLNGVIDFQNFEFEHLNAQDTAKLYYILLAFYHLKEKKQFNNLLYTHLFLLEDHLYRICLDNPVKGLEIFNYLKKKLYFFHSKEVENFHSNHLSPILKQMDDMLQRSDCSTVFHSLLYKSIKKNDQHYREADIKYHANYIHKKSQISRPLKVVKLALENSRNSVGGIAAVLKASASAHEELKLEKVRSLHPFYTHDKLRFKVKFKGIIVHEFKKELVKTSIYRDCTTKEYLAQPDPLYKSLFDLGSLQKGDSIDTDKYFDRTRPKDLYGNFTYSPFHDRCLYIASAAASFLALYCGKKANKAIDVVQSDNWHVGGPAFEILQSRFDLILQKAGLNNPKRVFLTHMLVDDLHEQGAMPTQTLTEIGGNTKGYKEEVNYTASGLIHSHMNVFVSQGIAIDAIHPSPELNKNLRIATLTNGGISKVRAITNGINTSLFNPSNKAQFGDFTLVKTFDQNGVETTDYVHHQQKVKKSLFDAGLITDPNKLLFLFVGRFSSEKGIDMLPAMIDEIESQGGQCVIMGLKTEDVSAWNIICNLKERAQKSNFLKVYTDPSDQTTPFKDKNGKIHELKENNEIEYSVKKGWLIRLAASIVMVPSHAEACGLVPMEAHTTGALVIAPYLQGLRDMCVSIGFQKEPNSIPLNLLTHANAMTYQNHNSQYEAQNSVAKAYLAITSLNHTELNTFMRQTHYTAINNYDWIIKDKQGILKGGATLKYSQLYHEVVHIKEQNFNVETFEQAYQRINQNY